MLNIKFN